METFAHYFQGKGRKELVISSTPDLTGHLSTISITVVSSKRQAREIAKQRGAQTWNF